MIGRSLRQPPPAKPAASIRPSPKSAALVLGGAGGRHLHLPGELGVDGRLLGHGFAEKLWENGPAPLPLRLHQVLVVPGVSVCCGFCAIPRSKLQERLNHTTKILKPRDHEVMGKRVFKSGQTLYYDRQAANDSSDDSENEEKMKRKPALPPRTPIRQTLGEASDARVKSLAGNAMEMTALGSVSLFFLGSARRKDDKFRLTEKEL